MHRSRRAVTTAAIILVAALGTSLGCAGSGSSAPAASAGGSATAPSAMAAGTEVGADDEGAALLEHHRHHHGGVAMFLSMSLDSLGLSDAERAQVAKVQSDLWTKLEPAHAAQHDVLAVLADGVAAGNVDKAKVDTAIGQVDATAPSVHAATNDALNQLHAILTPPERAALVQKLEAHWQVWQEANAEEPPADAKRGDHFSAMARELSLSPDQTEKLRASLHAAPAASPANAKKLDPAEADAHIKAFGDAFARDTFDAKALNGGEGMTLALPGHGIRRMARFYEAAAPVLTPDQRTKVAARLRQHADQESGK